MVEEDIPLAKKADTLSLEYRTTVLENLVENWEPGGGSGGGTATWETLAGKPTVIAAGDTAAAARAAIGAGTSDLTSGDVDAAISAATVNVVRSDDPRLSDARTPTAHTHATSEVTGLDATLAGKAASVHSHTASDVTGLATVATSGDYADLTNKPTIPAAVTWATLTGKPPVIAAGATVAAARAVIGAGTSNLTETDVEHLIANAVGDIDAVLTLIVEGA